MDEAHWSMHEFGSVTLGDQRRTDRLVAMGTQVAATPGGNVSAVFSVGAEREAAYRFVENDAVEAQEITAGAARAAVDRGRDLPFIFAPVDGSSLNLPDRAGTKRLGRVGTRKADAQGVQVMTAIGVSPDGTPLGILGQQYWTRERSGPREKDSRNRRTVEDKETIHWMTVMGQARAAVAEIGAETRLWFQLDRGGDAWPVLDMFGSDTHWTTVRASWDRRLVTDDPQQRYLWETMERAQLRDAYTLDVPASPDGKRAARTALMIVRAAEVTLDLVAKPSTRRLPTRLWGVFVKEQGSCPEGEDPIEWLLLTDHPVDTVEDARLVIFGYTQRWRIEQFHRIWKSGACNVEDNQLEDLDHILTWVTILASVAMRILRLTYLARHRPEEPATVELTRHEIDAAILVSETKRHRRGAKLTIAQAVHLIALSGGYTGKSSGGPPGSLVLARGLRKIGIVARILEKL